MTYDASTHLVSYVLSFLCLSLTFIVHFVHIVHIVHIVPVYASAGRKHSTRGDAVLAIYRGNVDGMALPLPSSEGCRPGYGSNGDSNVRGEEIEPTGGVSASVAEELAHTKSAVANICRHAATKSDLLNLGAVNKVFHEVASSEHVWDRLYSRDFPYHHVHLLSRWGGVGAMAGLGGSPDIPWYSEYRKRWHTERCWETGNLTRKAPVILSGHMGCVFGACFLKAPFTPGTICTGAHMEGEHTSGQDSTGEIKMWLPSRGTTVAQIVREFEVEGDRGEMGARFGGSGEVPAGMDVETFTRQEIARAVRGFRCISVMW